MQSGMSRLRLMLMGCFLLEDGQDLVEYGLIGTLIAVTAVAFIRPLAVPINALITTVSTSLTGA